MMPQWILNVLALFWFTVAPAAVAVVWFMGLGQAADWGWASFLLPMAVPLVGSVALAITRTIINEVG